MPSDLDSQVALLVPKPPITPVGPGKVEGDKAGTAKLCVATKSNPQSKVDRTNCDIHLILVVFIRFGGMPVMTF